MHLFFLKQHKSDICQFHDDDIHHIVNVLRLNIGDEVQAIDKDNKVYLLKITDIKPTLKTKIVKEVKKDSEYSLNLHLYLAVINRNKFEEAIVNATALYVNQITPVYFDRSQQKLTLNIQRCQKLINESIKQCNRATTIVINEPISFDQMVEKTKNNDSLNLVAYEKCLKTTLGSVLTDQKLINIIVGPEGGFSNKEAKQLDESKCYKFVKLTKSILRTELAVTYILSNIINKLGEK